MKKILSLLLFVLLASQLTSCGTVDNTLATLDKAIEALNAQPSTWHQVLDDAIKQIGDQSKEVTQELKATLQESVALTGVEVRCNVDFLGMSIKDKLIYIREKLLGHPKPLPSAWVCHILPDALHLQTVNGKSTLKEEPLIRVYGFNFYKENVPTINLYDGTLEKGSLSSDHVNLSSTYELLVNLQDVDFSGFKANSRIDLKWSNRSGQVPIVLPTPTPRPLLTTVTATVTQIRVIDDSDPFGSGELWFDFSVNGQMQRYPTTGVANWDSNTTHDITVSFTVGSLSTTDTVLISVNGTDDDSPQTNDELGTVQQTYRWPNWGTGFHKDRSSCPDGCYEISYQVNAVQS